MARSYKIVKTKFRSLQMQVSIKKVLNSTLARISSHKPASGDLDTRFSNFYAKKSRKDIEAAARVASIKARENAE